MSPLTGVRRQFVRAAMEAPYLSREEEHGLAVAWRDHKDRAALDRLTQAHMRLAIALAAKFRNYGLPMADLIQEGHVGLMEAAARFEPDREVRFSTYASWWIRAAIQDYVLKNWSIVRGGTSSAQKALFFNLRRLRAQIGLRISQGEQLDLHDEIAAAVGVSRQDVVAMEARIGASDISLDAPVTEADGAGAAERMDFLVSESPGPDEAVSELMDSERRAAWLSQALAQLSEREMHVVRTRRLVEDEDSATLESLGTTLGVSKERVRQIEKRALEKLKAALVRLNPGMARG
ncbi:MAG TPA: RNA polymerase factor sigma-32 [Beijerinckiaceae bacterium]|nr:RNA polymerase factor sigma-32 [Beijerinckiaceae bacterium]